MMNYSNRSGIVSLLLAASSLLVISSCGGGGSGGAGTDSGSGDSGGGGGAVTYTISGTVSGLNGTVVLQNNAGDNLTVPGDGSFTFAVAVNSGSEYLVTVLTQPIGQTCDVTNGSGTATANITNVALSCGDIPSAAAGYADKRILVAHVKFSDTGADPFPISETATRVDAITKFFDEISYGSSTQTYDVKPWMALPNPMSFYQQEDRYGKTLWPAAISLVEQTYDLVGADIVAVVLMPVTETASDGQTFAAGPGMFQVRYSLQVGGVTQVVPVVILSGNAFIGGSGNASIMSHEVGHAYGLPTAGIAGFLHSSRFSCKTWPNFLPPTLTDPTFNETDCLQSFGIDATFYPYTIYDFMGSYRGHPNVFWKKQAGWLGSHQIAQLQNSGSVVLDAIETSSSGKKAIQIPLGTDQSGGQVSYWVEYRSQKPIDLEDPIGVVPGGDPDRVKIWINLPNVPAGAVQGGSSSIGSSKVYTFDQRQVSNERNHTELAIGHTFSDPYRGLHVIRLENIGNAANVDVTLSDLRLDPAIGATIAAGSSQEIVVRNAGSQLVAQGPASIKGRNASSFQVVADNCGGTSLSPGESCSITVSYLFTGSTIMKFGSVEWTSDDPVRTTPSVGLVGIP